MLFFQALSFSKPCLLKSISKPDFSILFSGGSHSSVLSRTLQSNSYESISDWTVLSSNFSSTQASDTELVVGTAEGAGVYVIAFSVALSAVPASVETVVLVNGTRVCFGRFSAETAVSSKQSLVLTTALLLKVNDKLTFQVMGKSGMVIFTAARSLMKLHLNPDDISEGVSSRWTNNTTLSGNETVLSGFDYRVPYGSFYAENVTWATNTGFLAMRSGVYRIMANVVVRNGMAHKR